jgi:CheY-like chemotaxis protein
MVFMLAELCFETSRPIASATSPTLRIAQQSGTAMHTIPQELETQSRRGIVPDRVLIVDDDDIMADVLSVRLGQQGFKTTVAENGEQALAMARADRPSVILLDLRLPDIDGLEVCRELSDDEETSDIPVIIVSGLEHPDVIRRSRAAGCLYYLRKPYDPNALLTLIQQAIDEARD